MVFDDQPARKEETGYEARDPGLGERSGSVPSVSRTGREQQLGRKVGAKEQRMLKARKEQDRGVWFGLGMFGLVGWSVAIPTVIAIAVGVWIDRTWPSRFSWTLMSLFVGIVFGCMIAWYWVKRESGED